MPQIKGLVHESRHVTTHDLANEMEISSESRQSGLTQDLIMSWIAAKFLHLLLLMSNSRIVSVCVRTFEKIQRPIKFLLMVVIGGETQVDTAGREI
jgi:hypothetical protein